jgi:DNA replication protein DnaC
MVEFQRAMGDIILSVEKSLLRNTNDLELNSMERQRIWLKPDIVNELRSSIVGQDCGCDGSGGIFKDGNILDCSCMEKFKWTIQLLNAGIPKRYWDFDIENDLTPKFKKENETSIKIITKYGKDIQELTKQGVGLFIEGMGGTAKSASAYWIMKQALKQGISCYSTRMSTISNLLRGTIDNKDSEDLVLWMEDKVELLMIDEIEKDNKASDMHSITGTWVNEFFSNIYNRNTSLIVVSNISMKMLGSSQAANVVDRFNELIPVIMVGDSYRSDKRAKKLLLSKGNI